MFCPTCGTELPESASFCNQCGSPVPQPSPSVAETAPTPASAQSSEAPQTQPASDAQPHSPKSKGLLIGIIAAAAAVVLAVVVVLVIIPALGPKNAPVTFAMDYKGFQEGSSPIPVRVEGTDAEGNAISGLYGIDPATMTLNLPEGTFSIAPAGNVVNPDGSVLRGPRHETAEVTVTTEGQSSGGNCVALIDGENKPVTFTYERVAFANVTQDDIDNIANWTAKMAQDSSEAPAANKNVKGGVDPANVSIFYDDLVSAIDNRYHICTKSFEFDIPEYWRGKVRWDISENEKDFMIAGDEPLLSEVKIYAIANYQQNHTQEQELASIVASVDKPEVRVADYYGTPCDPIESHGIFVQEFVTNWAVGMSLGDPATPYLADLQTGGHWVRPESAYAASDKTIQALTELTSKTLSSVELSLTEQEAYELRKAHYHIETDYYEFDIPEYWWGKVEWTVDTYDSQPNWSMYKTPNTKAEFYIYNSGEKETLLTVTSYKVNSSDVDPWVGSYGQIPLQQYDVDGRRTRITTLNAGIYTFYASNGNGPTKAQVEACDLVTGGKLKELKTDDEDAYEAATRTFFETEFMPSFTLK